MCEKRKVKSDERIVKECCPELSRRVDMAVKVISLSASREDQLSENRIIEKIIKNQKPKACADDM